MTSCMTFVSMPNAVTFRWSWFLCLISAKNFENFSDKVSLWGLWDYFDAFRGATRLQVFAVCANCRSSLVNCSISATCLRGCRYSIAIFRFRSLITVVFVKIRDGQLSQQDTRRLCSLRRSFLSEIKVNSCFKYISFVSLFVSCKLLYDRQ